MSADATDGLRKRIASVEKISEGEAAVYPDIDGNFFNPPRRGSQDTMTADDSSASLASQVRTVLDEHVVEDADGFYSRWVEIETDLLREVLVVLEAKG